MNNNLKEKSKDWIINKLNSEVKLEGNNHNTNEIRTTKYRLWNFFPLSIYYQLHRISNIYFIILIIVGEIPGVSPLNNLTTIIPFVSIFAFTLLKEYYEDFGRFKNNLEINNHKVKVFKNNKFENITYKEIRHGDIIELKENEFAPADVLILGNEDNSKQTYIETSSLDGEKSAKPKFIIEEISTSIYNNKNIFSNFSFNFISSKPNSNINNMNGFLTINDKKYIITNKQFIPRGSKIKDINKIYVLVILTGHDTKIMLNTIKKDNKLSHVEGLMNKFIIFIMIFQLILMTLAIIFNVVLNNRYNRFMFLGVINNNIVATAFLSFLTYWILLNTLIPISLLVTVEVMRILQGVYIYLDKEMHDEERKIKQKIVTVNINEELGQINYLLSDKTGTLTMNKMIFRYLNNANFLYDFSHTDKIKTDKYENINELKIFDNKNLKNHSQAIYQSKREKNMNKRLSVLAISQTKFPMIFYSKDEKEKLKIETEEELFNLINILILTCHDCFIKNENGNIFFNGESPDEISFLEKWYELNIKMVSTNEKEIELSIFDNKIIVKKIGIIEFDNDRKCMSTIMNLEFKNKNYNFIFTKGADSAILERKNNFDMYIESINNNIEIFSNKGLRTLLLGFRILSNNELEIFLKDYEKYSFSKNINDIMTWEYDLNVLSSTAVEDKLVPNLDKTINYIKDAGIKLWIWTGDKLETAKQIGFSTNILNANENLNELKTEFHLDDFFSKYRKKFNLKQEDNLIMEGILLNKIFDSKELQDTFFKIVKDFKACVFCRVTPIQKAMIVSLVKSRNNITLAIGDGANDVSMITKADIGVGIFGNEGRQAVNSSDFGIPDFTKLNRLLFYHGRLNYLRTSKSILYFLYKNIVFTLVNFWFSFYSGFSGINFFNDFFISMYNTIITAFSLGPRSLLEYDVANYSIKYRNKKYGCLNYFDLTNRNKLIVIHKKVKKLFPFLYNIGKNNKIFSNKKFFVMISNAIFESLLLFFISIYSFNNYQSERAISSMCLYTIIVFNVTLKLYLNTNFIWVGHLIVTIFFSLWIYFLLIIIYNNRSSYIYSTYSTYLRNWTFYLTFFLGVLLLVVINFTIKIIILFIFPSEVQYINRYIKLNLKNTEGLKNVIDKNEERLKLYSDYINRY